MDNLHIIKKDSASLKFCFYSTLLENESNYIYLENIFVPKKLRGNGIATELMEEFMEIIYNFKQPKVFLNACPYESNNEEYYTDLDRLEKFYKKFGFEVYKRDYSYLLMIYKK